VGLAEILLADDLQQAASLVSTHQDTSK